jgi:hypothetical protein
MRTLAELQLELVTDKKEIHELKTKINGLENAIFQAKWSLESKERELALKNTYLTTLYEIYRIATFQFSRLRNEPKANLTPEDIAELNKWIGRAKTGEGINAIIQAIKELDKYSSSEIKSVYALVQKIIIEGTYKKKTK